MKEGHGSRGDREVEEGPDHSGHCKDFTSYSEGAGEEFGGFEQRINLMCQHLKGVLRLMVVRDLRWQQRRSITIIHVRKGNGPELGDSVGYDETLSDSGCS